MLSSSKLVSNSSELSTSFYLEKIGVSGLPNRGVRFLSRATQPTMLNSSKLMSNSSGTHRRFTQVSISRKSECPILEFEFLSRFFVNLLLQVLQVIVIA
jgi:hypothetical protein